MKMFGKKNPIKMKSAFSDKLKESFHFYSNKIQTCDTNSLNSTAIIMKEEIKD